MLTPAKRHGGVDSRACITLRVTKAVVQNFRTTAFASIRKVCAAIVKEASNPRFPFLFLEPNQNEAVANEERTLDEHAVGRE